MKQQRCAQFSALVVAAIMAISPAHGSPASQCAKSIFTPDTVPARQDYNDGSPLTVGMKFNSMVAGSVVGARQFMGPSHAGTFIATLWTREGVALGSAIFPPFTGPGWKEVEFAAPIPIVANQTYIISVHSAAGWYVATGGFFGSAVISPPLRGLAWGEDGPNGVYLYASGFPTASVGACYFADVVFESAVQNCPPDLNNDCAVDDSDFLQFIETYNILDCAAPEMPPGCPGDFDSNGSVDDSDFLIFLSAYNELVCP